MPPSGFWNEHGKPSYVAAAGWVPAAADPTPEEALRTGIERFLVAYGPATAGYFMQWSGQRRVGIVRVALRALGDRIVEFDGPGGEPWLDRATRTSGSCAATRNLTSGFEPTQATNDST